MKLPRKEKYPTKFKVKVPVLSQQIVVAEPIISQADSLICTYKITKNIKQNTYNYTSQ